MDFVKIIPPIVLFAILSACGSAHRLAIDWDAPSQREDGSPLLLSEIETYYIYYGNSPGDYKNTIDYSELTPNSVDISNFPSGTYYFVITTVTTDNTESRFSEELEIII